VISLGFAGELRPIVGGFDVPPWSAIARVWPLVWLPEIWYVFINSTMLVSVCLIQRIVRYPVIDFMH
jgi:hypothetical protein